MKYEKYSIESDEKTLFFEFTSIGPKGKIKKCIHYMKTNLKNFYNLGFGDKNEKTGEINDTIISNNGDTHKVLATVALSLYIFTNKYPEAYIIIRGSNTVRTRLYRIGITNNLQEINKDFQIFGQKSGKWHNFKTGIEYESFLIIRKKL